MDMTWMTVIDACRLISRHELSPLTLTEACLCQIERLNPRLNAFITVDRDLARSEATKQSPKGRLSPLYGIPIALKDLFETAGLRTTAGSKFFTDYVPVKDAFVVQKLKAAGAIILGKTNLHEIALGGTNVNPHYGTCRNPWDTSRISGGSSGGSAVAVATGMCLAALGTDTGGSIRIPSALCGTVGLKPTYGRVSLRGVIPLSWNLDHAGPMARTVRDSALLLSVMAGFDPDDPASAEVPVNNYLSGIEGGVKGWRVALAAGEYVEASDAEILAAVTDTVKVFKNMGAKIEKVDMDWLREAALANGLMIQADGAAYHRERLAEHPDWFGADVLQRLRNGAALTSTEYALARRIQVEMRRRFEIFFEKYDILLMPTTPIPAPPIEGTQAVEAARQLSRFTAPFNLTGLPALSVPCGFTASGLPMGLQIVSKSWGEAKVLQGGYTYEQATDWHDRHPKL
jgi:aspartyl-tRNA(Asn)/glutamyl-tRNA(Gln) amidotransferase subunit A